MPLVRAAAPARRQHRCGGMNAITVSGRLLKSPEIVVADSEHRSLSHAALIGSDHTAEDGDFLLQELDRATKVPEAVLPADVVRLGSLVRFRDETGAVRTLRLVLDRAALRLPDTISVLTKTGAALLGLREGQSLAWIDPETGLCSVTILEVRAPGAAIDAMPRPTRPSGGSFLAVAMMFGALLLWLLAAAQT